MIEQTQHALMEKWNPLLSADGLPKIADSLGRDDPHRARVTAQLLENTETALATNGDWSPQSLMEANPINQTGNVANYDPVLISLVRRAMPNLMAYDVAGVQPMTGPTGLIFALRSHYANSTNADIGETFYNEVDTDWSATGYSCWYNWYC